MIVVDLEQGSDEWFKEKLGKPSASNINKIITSTGKKSTQRESYRNELVGERITGRRDETFTNAAMEQGNTREEESRKYYSLMKDGDIENVGVVYKDEDRKFLCSPDAIVRVKGKVRNGLELKNVLQKTQVKRLDKGVVPTEYVLQIQFSLFVTGLDRWDFCSYCPDMPPFIIQVGRDEKLIKLIETEVNSFCDEIDATYKKIKV